MEVEKDKAEKELKELMARFKLRKARPCTATPHTMTRTTPLASPPPLTLLATLPPPSPPLPPPLLQALLHWRHRKLTLSFRTLIRTVFAR